jgi:hypothetical protein
MLHDQQVSVWIRQRQLPFIWCACACYILCVSATETLAASKLLQNMANAIGQELMQILEFNKTQGDRKICPRCYVLYRYAACTGCVVLYSLTGSAWKFRVCAVDVLMLYHVRASVTELLIASKLLQMLCSALQSLIWHDQV